MMINPFDNPSNEESEAFVDYLVERAVNQVKLSIAMEGVTLSEVHEELVAIGATAAVSETVLYLAKLGQIKLTEG